MNVKTNGFNHNGEAKELSQIQISLDLIKKFLFLVQELDKIPNMKRTSYDAARSFYHSVSTGHSLDSLAKQLEMFFGPPKKPAGHPLPMKMKFNPSVKYLRGVRHEQAFFIKKTKTGLFYGALWPWQKNTENITIHLGYCSNKMSDKDFENLEKQVKSRVLNEGVFKEFESDEGSRVHGISLASFLHMAMLEKLSCSIEIKTDGVVGHLHMVNGELIDAKTGSLKNKAAAYEIISWEDAEIEIKGPARKKSKHINEPLMEILIEALRLRKTEKDKKNGPSDLARQVDSTSDSSYDRYNVLLESARQDRKKKRIYPIAAAVLGTLIFAGASMAVWKGVVGSRNIEHKYKDIIAQVDAEENLEEKKKILTNYIKSNENTGFSKDAQDKLKEVDKVIEDKEYGYVVGEVEKMKIDDDYSMKAKDTYMTYLKKYPEGIHTADIEDRIFEITDRIDDFDFEQIQKSKGLEYNDRIQAYMNYMIRHPNGKYREDVERMTRNLGNEYYSYLIMQVPLCDKNSNWETCIQLCDFYLSNFTSKSRSAEIAELKKKMIDKTKAKALFVKVNKLGNNYKKVKSIFLEFLSVHPDSYELKKVQIRLEEVNKKIAENEQWKTLVSFIEDPGQSISEKIDELSWYIRQNRSSNHINDAKLMLNNLKNKNKILIRKQKEKERYLKELATQQEKDRIRKEREKTIGRLGRVRDRYKINGNDTITDTKTGLTWCLLDSSVMLKNCQDYNSAVKYVQSLKTGGHNDWRLPLGSELAAIYKNPPFFPDNGAKWYWTAESYAKGYHNKVLIVTAKNERIFKREDRLSSNCGAVRAVRP